MLNLALVGLLAGSLVSPAPDGDKDKHRSQNAPAAEAAAPQAVTTTPDVNLGLVPPSDTPDPRVITADTYMFGRPVTEAPIKLWVHYAWGESEGAYDFQGETIDIGGDIVVNSIGVGAHINFLNFPAFQLGAGAQLNVAQRKFQAGEGSGAEDIESDFGLQNVKVYGSARGRVLGVHGGYIFDLGSEAEFDSTGGGQFGGGGGLTSLANSDGRSAVVLGADFDYPSDRFRLFGGVDYFLLEGADAGELEGDSTFPDGSNDGDNIIAWVMGAGLRFGGFELGAALQIQTQIKNGALNTTGTGVHLPIGSHLGSVSPYLRFSPTFFPASIFIQGGVNPEYVTRGYALGGANAFKPSLGFTAGITVGFD
jgi:hypothetical protein